jgi:hypothetical protein
LFHGQNSSNPDFRQNPHAHHGCLRRAHFAHALFYDRLVRLVGIQLRFERLVGCAKSLIDGGAFFFVRLSNRTNFLTLFGRQIQLPYRIATDIALLRLWCR